MVDLKLLNKLATVSIPTIDSHTGVFKLDKRVPYNIEPSQVSDEVLYRNMSVKLLVEQYSTPMEKCVSMIATFFLARHSRQEYNLFINKHKDNTDILEKQDSMFNISRTIANLICENNDAEEEIAKAIFTSAMIVLILYKDPEHELNSRINSAYLSQVEILCDILHEFEGPTRIRVTEYTPAEERTNKDHLRLSSEERI